MVNNRQGCDEGVLINYREEVAKVTNLDFTFERQIELEREEAMLYGAEQEIFKRVQEGDYGITRGAEKLGVTEAEFVEKMKRGPEMSSVKESNVIIIPSDPPIEEVFEIDN